MRCVAENEGRLERHEPIAGAASGSHSPISHGVDTATGGLPSEKSTALHFPLSIPPRSRSLLVVNWTAPLAGSFSSSWLAQGCRSDGPLLARWDGLSPCFSRSLAPRKARGALSLSRRFARTAHRNQRWLGAENSPPSESMSQFSSSIMRQTRGEEVASCALTPITSD